MTSATLGLYNSSPMSGRTIDVYQAAAAWLGTTVTWANQPAAAGTGVGVVTSASAGLQQWAVTAHVQAQYAGSNNGFLLRDRTEDDAAGLKQTYASREAGSNLPRLIVNWG